MNMIKLVAIDVDDTLLNSQHQIPKENLTAIAEARAKGVQVILATGRMHVAALPFAKQLQLPANELLISYNGALVQQVDGTLVEHIALPHHTVLKVIEYSQKHNLTLNAYYNDELYVQEIDRYVAEYCKVIKVDAIAVGNLLDFLNDGNKPLSKMLIISEQEDVEQRLPELQQLLAGSAQVTRSKANFIEITDLSATKGQALARLTMKLGLEREQVMAIGDSGNDLSMIEYAGIGVAMGNAREPIQRVADHITTSHDQAGVAKALRQFI